MCHTDARSPFTALVHKCTCALIVYRNQILFARCEVNDHRINGLGGNAWGVIPEYSAKHKMHRPSLRFSTGKHAHGVRKTRKAYQLLMFPVCYNGLYMKEERTQYHERIVTDPRILSGKPVVKGTRIAVDLVLEELSLNPDVTELLAAHPDLTRDDVQACLAYAKDILTGQEVSPKPPRGARSNASL